MTDLGPDWVPDEDGIPHRRAARVLLFDERGRLLLIQGHDDHRRDRHWWFTIGGGMEGGETPAQTAVRELCEETGIVVRREDLVGPVMLRYATFDFDNVVARQDEFYFLARTDTTQIDTSGWTDLEQSVLDAIRWWPIDELTRCSGIDEGIPDSSKGDSSLCESTELIELHPKRLVEYLRLWEDGWDGSLLEIRDD